MKLKGGHWVVSMIKSMHNAIPSQVLIGEIKKELEPVGKRKQMLVHVKTSASTFGTEYATIRYKQDWRHDLHRMEGWKHDKFFLTLIDNGYVLGKAGLISLDAKQEKETMETYIAALEKTVNDLTGKLKQEGMLDIVERDLRRFEVITKYMKSYSQNLSPAEELAKMSTMRKMLEPGKSGKK